MQLAVPSLGTFSVRLRHMSARPALLWTVVAVYVLISTLTRLALVVKTGATGQVTLAEVPRIVLTGVVYDVVTSFYLMVPLAVYLAIAPARLLAARAHRLLLYAAFGATVASFVYLGVVEYFFFDEFNARFNFVAFEYLVYPHEVFVNIWNSYPVARALMAAAAVGLGSIVVFRRALDRLAVERGRRKRFLLHLAALLTLLVIAQLTIDLDTSRTRTNRVADEVAANGIYSFFNAAVNSRLDYDAFYLTVPKKDAIPRVRAMVAQDNASFIAGAANPLAREVKYAGAPKPLHVIVLLQESLGAEFVGAYGDKRGLTPNIDRLARESIVFENTYATGTRTVRGIEAVTASFPPVPAESIVKREHNEGMFNWSTIMRDAGYTPTFIYGGYGTFDNMNYFFRNNGYEVIDRTDMATPRFSNIWGVSDEDLFDHAFKVFDRQHARGERIFSVILSTSNHKPFTFRPGVPGVPEEGGGREAGIRYADYAIGRFMDTLKTHPYADDTVVVIVADHGARVYGREDFPLHSYRIPFLVHAPRHFAPRVVHTATSQLDVAPTVLGLLKRSYASAFFGRDALEGGDTDRSVPMNHNRDIALMTGDRLNELGFRGTSSTVQFDAATQQQHAVRRDENGIHDAASLFQLAYNLYISGRYAAR
jgi:phosphoglycerol transferase MdoB-like AlkP superfamily enzyme